MSKEALTKAYHEFAETQKITPSSDVAPRFVLFRMSALGGDVKSAVEVLLSTYETAQVAVRELREAMLLEAEAPGDSKAATRHLFERQEVQRRAISAFKSVFFFVRAYQDAVCGFLIALEREPVGRNVSMAKRLKKKDGSISTLVDEKLPSYRDWLAQWKKDRDATQATARADQSRSRR